MDRTVTRLIGVYDADGTVLGELSYFLRARVGRAHCDLCDITHGRVRERADWRQVRDALPVPFETFHRDDQPAAVRGAAAGTVPIVTAHLDDGSCVVLLRPDDLAACAGSPDALVEQVRTAMSDAGLGWPIAGGTVGPCPPPPPTTS